MVQQQQNSLTLRKKRSRVYGKWLLIGCYFRINGQWKLEWDYFYAPYFEIWNINVTRFSIVTYHAVLKYACAIKKRKLIASAYDIFGSSELHTYTYLIRFLGKRLYLVLVDKNDLPERVYVFEPTGWKFRRSEADQPEEVKKMLEKKKRKIHWLQKDELEKLECLELPL